MSARAVVCTLESDQSLVNRAGLHKYKVEPYAAAAMCMQFLHNGRGGWTWYTGSAGWMYRAGVESILGFKLQKDRRDRSMCSALVARVEIVYRRKRSVYRIKIENPLGVSRGVVNIEVDGVMQTEEAITLWMMRRHTTFGS